MTLKPERRQTHDLLYVQRKARTGFTGYSQGASEAPDYNPAQHVNYTTLPTRLARCIFLPFFRRFPFMAKRKHPKLPNGFGSIKKLSGNRTNKNLVYIRPPPNLKKTAPPYRKKLCVMFPIGIPASMRSWHTITVHSSQKAFCLPK